MAVQLDTDERAKVEAGRRTPRPNYFNAASLQDTPISEDFEAFLILQDSATITATLTWLAATGLLARLRLDRDAVAFETLVVERNDRIDQLDEVTSSTIAFSAWRQAFQAGKFSETSEVGLIIRDAQAMAGELFALEERLNHLAQVEQRVEQRLAQSVSSAQLRELQSWPTPLLAY